MRTNSDKLQIAALMRYSCEGAMREIFIEENKDKIIKYDKQHQIIEMEDCEIFLIRHYLDFISHNMFDQIMICDTESKLIYLDLINTNHFIGRFISINDAILFDKIVKEFKDKKYDEDKMRATISFCKIKCDNILKDFYLPLSCVPRDFQILDYTFSSEKES